MTQQAKPQPLTAGELKEAFNNVRCGVFKTAPNEELDAIEAHISWLEGQRNAERIAREEREASCCPEDVGFEEYISSLTKRAEKAEAESRRLREALEAITRVAGNLPDDRLTDRTGPNDAAQRGLMVVCARDLARVALAAPVPSNEGGEGNG